MRIIYHITIEDAEKIAEYRKSVHDKREDKRLYAVELRGRGMRNEDISQKLDTDKRVVSRWVSQYVKGGIEAICNKKRESHNRNMPYEKEEEILSAFEKEAEKGQIIEASSIKKAFEDALGRELGSAYVYRVLKRHNWTKKMPRSRHPKKADDEAINASKKLKIE